MEVTSIHDFEHRYEEPVRQLLGLGETRPLTKPDKWPDYLGDFALGPQHIGDLIEMACDRDLNESDSDQPYCWAPMHAWRCLGQVQAEAAVVPLLEMLAAYEDHDFAVSELPAVFSMIGPSALPPIAAIIRHRSSSMTLCSTAIDSVEAIGKAYPDARARCVEILTRMLERGTSRKMFENGFAVGALVGLGAVEAIDTIREAFRRKAVDLTVIGDEEDVEIALGLKTVRSTPAPFIDIFGSMGATRQDKPGRNDPCPCGSGKKYKKCCLP